MKTEGLFSFHGGHSGPACSHAEDSLAAMVQSAIRHGMQAFAVTEHMPKPDDHFLDEFDRQADLNASDTLNAFRILAKETFPAVMDRFGTDIELFWGLETDVTPSLGYADRIREMIDLFEPAYLVGSVHHVCDTIIDDCEDSFAEMAQQLGGLEAVQLEYFRLQAELIDTFKPMVVGHFDLIRVHAPIIESEPIRAAICNNLERIADFGLLMELNSSPPRDHPGTEPFPSIDIVKRALDAGVCLTLGDDSHSATQVFGGLIECVDHARVAGCGALYGLEISNSGLAVPNLRLRL